MGYAHILVRRGRGHSMQYVVELLQSRRTVRFSVFLVCALSLIAAALCPAESQTTTTALPSLHILPIHRAKFLAGARFDLRVEANHLPVQPTVWEITVAGKTLEAFFGTPGQITPPTGTSQEQTLRDVTLTEPGTYTVSARVVAGATTLTKTVTYEVVAAKPTARQAKNVILFIGDGMSLPIRTAAR